MSVMAVSAISPIGQDPAERENVPQPSSSSSQRALPAGDPGAGQPAAAQADAPQPAAAPPVAGKPAAAQPVAAQPRAAEQEKTAQTVQASVNEVQVETSVHPQSALSADMQALQAALTSGSLQSAREAFARVLEDSQRTVTAQQAVQAKWGNQPGSASPNLDAGDGDAADGEDGTGPSASGNDNSASADADEDNGNLIDVTA